MGNGTERECIRCELDPGYNRAIVDVETGAEIGSLCRDCESAALEESIVQTGDRSHTCGLCARDGFFALPKWLPRTEAAGDVIVYTVDYTLDRDAIYLCDEHLYELTEEPATTPTELRMKKERR